MSMPASRATPHAQNGNTAPEVGYRTTLGTMLVGRIEHALEAEPLSTLPGKVNLIFTSPPFPLIRKKRYGNKTGDEYLRWLSDLAPRLTKLLAKDGSLVLELGHAWEKGKPVMSTLPIEALLAFKASANLHLCQQFVCHNPARLPGPAQWTNVERIRVKDAFTHVWWLSSSERPKADNRRILTPYSPEMKHLLKSKRYNAGRRPSGHVVGETSFLTDNGGAIAPNVIDFSEGSEHVPNSLLTFSNTAWSADYVNYCKKNNLKPHPARMQPGLVSFFINFLTDPKDLIFDPFAGSNTTGAVAEQLERRWLSLDANEEYVRGSRGRFPKLR